MAWRYLQDLGDAFLSQVNDSQRGGKESGNEGGVAVVRGEVVAWFKWSNSESMIKISKLVVIHTVHLYIYRYFYTLYKAVFNSLVWRIPRSSA